MTINATSLHDAARKGDTSALTALLRRGAEVDGLDHRAMTPLMWAARRGHIPAMKALIDAGADIDGQCPGTTGWPPLLRALHKDQKRAALALLSWGADPNTRGDGGFTALMLASARGDLGLVESLLARGADPRARLVFGFTALDYAVAYGHSDVARLLLWHAPELGRESDASRDLFSVVGARRTLRGL